MGQPPSAIKGSHKINSCELQLWAYIAVFTTALVHFQCGEWRKRTKRCESRANAKKNGTLLSGERNRYCIQRENDRTKEREMRQSLISLEQKARDISSARNAAQSFSIIAFIMFDWTKVLSYCEEKVNRNVWVGYVFVVVRLQKGSARSSALCIFLGCSLRTSKWCENIR